MPSPRRRGNGRLPWPKLPVSWNSSPIAPFHSLLVEPCSARCQLGSANLTGAAANCRPGRRTNSGTARVRTLRAVTRTRRAFQNSTSVQAPTALPSLGTCKGWYTSPVTHSLCRSTASFRATATSARFFAFFPPRSASSNPSAADHGPVQRDPECSGHLGPARFSCTVAFFADVQLRLTLAGVSTSWAKAHVATHVPASREAVRVVHRQHECERDQHEQPSTHSGSWVFVFVRSIRARFRGTLSARRLSPWCSPPESSSPCS